MDVGNILVWAIWVGAAIFCLGSAIAVVSFANPFFSALAPVSYTHLTLPTNREV